MKLNFKSIVALFLLMLGVVAWLPPFLVSATSVVNPVISISQASKQDEKGLKQFCTDTNMKLHEKDVFVQHGSMGVKTNIDFLTYEKDGDVINITINMVQYNKLVNSEQQKVMQVALDTIYNSTSVSQTNRNKVYNQLCQLDTTTSNLVRQLSNDVSADFNEAYKWFSVIVPAINVFLGLACIFIFTMLAVTIVVDIAYITIPGVQMALGKLEDKLDGVASKKIHLASIEAANAIKISEDSAGKEYINPLGVYFKSKTKQLVMCAICLLYLSNGEIFSIIASWIDMFQGFLK